MNSTEGDEVNGKEALSGYPVPLDDEPAQDEDENQDIEHVTAALEKHVETALLNNALAPDVAPHIEIPGGLWRSSIQVVAEAKEEIVWLIPGVLPAGTVVLLSGREGSMKSWLAMSMARAVAAGVPWLGKRSTQGAVLYLDGEMPPAVLRDRLRGIGPVEQLNIWSWTDAGFPIDLNDAGLQQASQCHTLIVVDTLRRQMQDLKENSADDMAKLTNGLRELTRYGAAVLALHHAPKDPGNQGYRGSTELGAGVDITMLLTKKQSGANTRLTIETHKTRYSSFGDLEIGVEAGEGAPLLTATDSTAPYGDEKLLLDRLGFLIDELRLRGQDHSQGQIIDEAKKQKLAGKDKILRLLKAGENTHWQSIRVGNRITYRLLDIS